MSSHSVTHATFSLDRTYSVPPARVFRAWADPEAKARWFAGPGNPHELDFRVGGREVNQGSPGGRRLTFESTYQDIVPNGRIVYASTLSVDGVVATVSITTVELRPDGGGTLLVLTEQDTFLDGAEQPDWREQGTGQWLDALAGVLEEASRTTS
jgi:uncharacterized protein YndB with AHSA1/START domain